MHTVLMDWATYDATAGVYETVIPKSYVYYLQILAVLPSFSFLIADGSIHTAHQLHLTKLLVLKDLKVFHSLNL